ncbi:MAG: circularly permuted type 2 ATP-grasp protein [Rubrivivax sp.]|nr:circularly permuted type 2 ATP-grasp protein [Rubrivivax sp.]
MAATPAARAELDRRVAQVAQQLHRDGVTHNVFGDGGSGATSARPWSLELLPHLIEAHDWSVVEAGIAQRAALLEAMLADLHGPKRLLHEGLLPPALLWRHPGWLRPLLGPEAGSVPAGGQRLFIVAFDLGRDAAGRWCVLAQRTQAPSGPGYVLHNRLVISRQFPEAFRELRVQHIASSYRALLTSVEQRATALTAGGSGTPRIVLLTPGPYSETYFEHAYLARYLGLPLAEGGDLTVRGEQLFLMTVEGLERVHGVLRRVDDDWCDPLELRPDSALGVPGLLQAVRCGNVVMANALGSAFLETPALNGFLPAIARRLLGQELALPALPSWWCGEAAAWADVRGRLAGVPGRRERGAAGGSVASVGSEFADFVVRSTYPSGVRTSRVVAADTAAIEADPEAFTLQARLALSHAPTWGANAVRLRPAVVRVYAIADAAGRWHVLPGGMTRVAGRNPEDGRESISMQRGGASIDTWVLTEGAVDTFSMLASKLTVDDLALRRRPVASRTGENLFWLGRYTERTEQLVRLARVVLALTDAASDPSDDGDAGTAQLRALSEIAVRTGLAPAGVPGLDRSPHHFERAVLAAIGDANAAGGACGIAFDLRALEQASMALRERLSGEHWGLIRQMREAFAEGTRAAPGHELPSRARVLAALDALALHLAAVTGAQTDRMTRDHGWRLLTVGRLIERLIGLATRWQCFLGAQALGHAAGVELLLDLADSLITFRARYQRHEDLLPLTELLVLDSTNPRSLAGVLRRLRTELGKLPEPAGAGAARPLSAWLPASGAGLTLEDLRGLTETEVAARLQALASELANAAAALANEVGERYFNLAHGEDRRV